MITFKENDKSAIVHARSDKIITRKQSFDPRDWYYYQNNDPSTNIILGLKTKHTHDEGYMPGNFGDYEYSEKYGANQKDYVIPDGVTTVGTSSTNIFSQQYENFNFEYGGTPMSIWTMYPLYFDYPDDMTIYYPDSITSSINIGHNYDQNGNYWEKLKKIRFPNNFDMMIQLSTDNDSDFGEGIFGLSELTIPPGTSILQSGFLQRFFPHGGLDYNKKRYSLEITYSHSISGNTNTINYPITETLINSVYTLNGFLFGKMKKLNIVRDENNPTITIEPLALNNTALLPRALTSSFTNYNDFTNWYTLQNGESSIYDYPFDKELIEPIHIYCNCAKENIIFSVEDSVDKPSLLANALYEQINEQLDSGYVITNIELVKGTASGSSQTYVKTYNEIPTIEQIFDDVNILPIKTSRQLFVYLESIGHVHYNADITNN